MKRIYIAVLLLTAVTLASLFEVNYVRDTADDYTRSIKELDSLIEENALDKANEKINSLSDEWSGTAEKMDILLIHDYVDNIGMNIARMQAYLKLGNTDMYYSESESAKKGLASIKGSEYPNLENIL